MTNNKNNNVVICKPFLRDMVYNLIKKDKIENACAICLEDIQCKHCFSLLSCGHSFHAYCIHNITRCPMCRS